MTTSMVGLGKQSHRQKSHQKMVNPRDIAGNAEEKGDCLFVGCLTSQRAEEKGDCWLLNVPATWECISGTEEEEEGVG